MGNQIFVGSSVFAQSTSTPFVSAFQSVDSSSTSSSMHVDASGKPCRACTDFKSWAKMQAGKRKDSTSSSNNNSKSSASPLKDPEPRSSEEEEYEAMLAERAHLQCPLDKDELGRSTWSFLHTMASYYPDNPSKTQQKEMSAFMKIFAKYYPCEHCAQDFQKSIKESPPETNGRTEFAQWMCKMHNEVNRKLGKPEFDCGKVDDRWKDGWNDGSCDY